MSVLKSRLGSETSLEQIVYEIWQAMRSVQRPVGRPRYDESMFQSALDLVRSGHSLRSVRAQFGFGATVASRIKKEL